MFLIELTSAAQGLKLKNGGGMKIRIAKKKLKKVISDAYQINKRRVKLTRTYFAFRSGYGYRYRDDSMGFYSIRIRAKKKPTIVTKRSLLRLMKDMYKADEREYVPETETMEDAYKQPPRTRRCCRIHGTVNNSK